MIAESQPHAQEEWQKCFVEQDESEPSEYHVEQAEDLPKLTTMGRRHIHANPTLVAGIRTKLLTKQACTVGYWRVKAGVLR